jgi:hypothetical protein
MTSLRNTIVTLAALGLALPAARLLAITEADAANGRALSKRYADTVVSVELVATIKMTVGDRALPPRENRMDVNGTVITPSGLTVTVLSLVDPHGAMEAMRAAQGMGGQKIEIGETEFKDVKLRLANNTEVPSVIVLKDPDLNLVFIAPLVDATAKPRTFPCISLDKAAAAEVLGNYYYVTRAHKNLQRVPIVRETTVVGIVEKPRRMFLMSDQALGVPVLDPAGLVLGIATQYLENGRPTNVVILSAADVAELGAQAAAIKPEEKEEKPEAAEKAQAPANPASAAPAPANPPPGSASATESAPPAKK